MKVRTPSPGLLLALLVALGAGGWFAWRWYTTPVPPQIRLDGVQKELAESVERALEDVRRQPRSGAAWGKLAMILHVNGFDDHDVDCYRNAERFDPKNPRWPYLHAVRILDGDRPQAVLLLRQALAVAENPDDRAVVLFRLARVLLENQELDEAERHLQALREIESDSPRVHFGLGELAVARDDRLAARRHLTALIQVPFARKHALARLAALEDSKETARKYQEDGDRLPRDRPWPDLFEDRAMRLAVERLNRIAVYLDLKRQGRHQEAVQFLRAYVAEAPDAEVCFKCACELFRVNELDEAEQLFRAAIRLDPLRAKAHLFLCGILLQKGESRYGEAGGKDSALELFRETVDVADRALALEPTLGHAHLTRGRALRYLGRTDEAVRALRQALLLQPNVAEAHRFLGETLAESGQLQEGLKHLENAVQVAPPDDPQPRETLEKWRAKAKESEKK